MINRFRLLIIIVFPTGRFGAKVRRPQPVKRFMFVRWALRNRDKRFRRCQQWLLTELDDANMRAVSSGAFVLLKTSYAKKNLTAGE